MAAARASFDGMPRLRRVAAIAGECGADQHVNQDVAYCTTRNVVFLSDAAAARPEAPYLVAHVLGHAVQVRHGIADVALAQIRARRSEEPTLRGYVASQVECVAGFMMARAGQSGGSLADWFTDEPFTGTHWGRDPLRVGPQVAIGLAGRDAWFQRGQNAATLQDCAAGEFGAELLLRAYKG
jgi:predicted metalloprotease